MRLAAAVALLALAACGPATRERGPRPPAGPPAAIVGPWALHGDVTPESVAACRVLLDGFELAEGAPAPALNARLVEAAFVDTPRGPRLGWGDLETGTVEVVTENGVPLRLIHESCHFVTGRRGHDDERWPGWILLEQALIAQARSGRRAP